MTDQEVFIQKFPPEIEMPSSYSVRIAVGAQVPYEPYTSFVIPLPAFMRVFFLS